MKTSPTLPATISLQARVPGERATTELACAPDAREDSPHRRVVQALARRSPLTGIVVLEYGLRYAAAAFRAGTKWALYFAAGCIVSFCAVLGAPGLREMMAPDSAEVRMQALGGASLQGWPAEPVAAPAAECRSCQEDA